MKQHIFPALLFLILINFQKCANPMSPTGGQKDTIPPMLISSNPVNEQLNFNGKTFELAFSELVTAEKLKQSLVITPAAKLDYKSFYKKNKVIITFSGSFQDSTTYTLNFADGITDITEKNPVENLVLAFSTGSYIDSLQITGQIAGLYDQKPLDGYTIGLYQYSDTLDVKREMPLYFIQSDKQGQFTLRNIKVSFYKLVSFKDENRNQKMDPATEPHAFLPGILELNENLDSAILYATLLDVTPLELYSARPTGLYFDIRYNKPVNEYKLEYLDTLVTEPLLASQFSDNNTTVRILNSHQMAFSDSVGLVVSARDTIQQVRIDTLYVQFRESSRKPAEYVITSSTTFDVASSEIQSSIDFSKPTYFVDSTKLQILLDSALSYPIKQFALNWNFNHSKLQLSIPFAWEEYSKFVQSQIDVSTDSVKPNYPTNSVNIFFLTGTFVSVENDSSQLIKTLIRQPNLEEFGTITVSVNTDHTSFFLQILDQQKSIVRQSYSEQASTFRYLLPGTYSIRVLIDNDNDGYWSPGNINLDKKPEDIYLHNQTTQLKANWEVTVDNVSF